MPRAWRDHSRQFFSTFFGIRIFATCLSESGQVIFFLNIHSTSVAHNITTHSVRIGTRLGTGGGGSKVKTTKEYTWSGT